MGVIDDAKAAVKRTVDTYKTGAQQSRGMGAELAAKKQMIDEGRKALTGSDAAPKPEDKPVGGRGQIINPKAQYGDRPGEKRIDTSEMTKPLGSYKKGTPRVPKTGNYKLHEGEAVIPAEKNPMNVNPFDLINKGAKKPKKEIKEIRSRRAHDGKIIHTHIHHHPEHHPDEEHVSNDMDALHNHFEDHAGTPNEGEAAPVTGGPAQLTAAPSPMPEPPAQGAPTAAPVA